MSSALAALVAHVVFWVLLAYGWATEHLSVRGLVVAVLIWIAALVGLPSLSWTPAADMVSSVVAVLDIVLVLIIFKGDLRLT